MVMYETSIKALPLRFWHLLNKHPHILQFWDSVKSIYLLLLILAVLEHAPNTFLKGEEMTRKPGTVCHKDIKNPPWPYLNCYSEHAVSRKQILFSDSINHSELFYLQPQRMDNLTLT